MSGGETGVKVRRRLTGAAFLTVLVLLVWLSIAVYQKAFTSPSMVVLRTGSVGNEMHLHADVKLHGVVVGEVRRISANGSGARLDLALQPETLERLPANVTAQMLPTTLFGERFVALVPPPIPSPQHLAAGATITQDRSSNAIELEQVLQNVLPLLTSVQPAKLSATLTAMSQALEGRGTELGQTLVRFNEYLAKLNPHLPELNRDLSELVRVTRFYGDAAPDLVRALHDLTVTSRTLAEQRETFARLYSSITDSAQDITEFLRNNSGNIILLAAHSRPSLEKLARYSPEFPCTLKMLREFVPAIDRALGKGTSRHGLRVIVNVTPSRGKYLPGRDRPAFKARGGPHCFSVPFTGTAASVKAAGVGQPNSPGENDLINELTAPQAGQAPQDLPDWSSVLIGPLYRGAEVTVK
jgi:phospholipid/cholesterol/gamma-HCH transport system substrate-binding protein